MDFLRVGSTEHCVCCKAKGENSGICCVAQDNRIMRKILRLDCVEAREENSIAPGKHHAEMIMRDVHRFEIPVFVEEKIEHVDGMEENNDKH